MDNQNYPYGGGYGYGYNGYNYSPDWNQPYTMPPKKKLSEKIRDAVADERYRRLIICGTLTGAAVMCYFILSTVYSFVMSSNSTLWDMYRNNYLFRLIAEMFYSIICVGLPFFVSLIIMRATKVYDEPLPYEKPRGGVKVFLMIFAGLGICFIGNVVTSLLYNYAAAAGFEFRSFSEAVNNPTPVPDNIVTALFMVIHTAVVPALIEEFAFRGVVMQPLRKYGDWFAIIVTGVMFGLLHGNMMQVPFAIIAGVALGYIAIVSGSIWTSVLLHFLNNFISLIYTTVSQLIPQGGQMILSAMVIYGLIFIGIIAFAGYAFENRNFYRLRPGEYHDTRKKTLVYFLMPTMIVAIIIMVVMTLGDISFRG